MENSKTSGLLEATFLRRETIFNVDVVLTFRVIEVVGISVHHFSETTHESRSSLACDNISDFKSWLSNQVFFLARKSIMHRFLFNVLEIRRMLSEETISNLARWDLSSYHIVIAVQIDFVRKHVVERVVKAWALWNCRSLFWWAYTTLKVGWVWDSVGGKGGLGCRWMVCAVTTLDYNSFWNESSLLNFFVKQVVEITRNKTLFRARNTARTFAFIFRITSVCICSVFI